jgi:hypothetical protein
LAYALGKVALLRPGTDAARCKGALRTGGAGLHRLPPLGRKLFFEGVCTYVLEDGHHGDWSAKDSPWRRFWGEGGRQLEGHFHNFCQCSNRTTLVTHLVENRDKLKKIKVLIADLIPPSIKFAPFSFPLMSKEIAPLARFYRVCYLGREDTI